MSRGLAIYFGILFVLTLISLSSDAITIGLLLFMLPGLILIASSTLLYYSIAVLPAYLIDRFFAKRLLAIVVAAIGVAAAALLPHYVDGYLLGGLVAADHSDPPPSFRPRSFELPYPKLGNYWTNWRRPESRRSPPPAPCTDLCQQLLFKGNVDQVVIRDNPDPLSDGTLVIRQIRAFRLGGDGLVQDIHPSATAPNPADVFKRKWRRFRLEQRVACPDTLSLIEGEFVREVLGGRCLVEDTVDSADPDVVLSITEPRRENHPGDNAELRRIQTGPTTVTITQRRDERAIPVEVKTTLVAHDATIPFHFTAERCGNGFIPPYCLVVATDPFWRSFADPYEMIARRYGFAIARTPFSTRFAVPVSDDDRSTVVAILKQDYGAGGYIPTAPSMLVASFVNARLESEELNQDDIELIRVLLKQRAFAAAIDSSLPPSTYQAALKPLLSDMFERIADRAHGQDPIVGSLIAILGRFPAEDTDPYWLDVCRDRGDLWVCRKRERHRARKIRNGHKN
jgi:hypothetical protein